MISGWCSTFGRPQCHLCRFPSECAHDCHETANRAQHKGNQRGVETVKWDNWGTSKSAPAGVDAPVVPGLTDDRSAG